MATAFISHVLIEISPLKAFRVIHDAGRNDRAARNHTNPSDRPDDQTDDECESRAKCCCSGVFGLKIREIAVE
jgi:hypothetical protein